MTWFSRGRSKTTAAPSRQGFVSCSTRCEMPRGSCNRRAIGRRELPAAVEQGAVNVQSNQTHSHISNCTVKWDALSADTSSEYLACLPGDSRMCGKQRVCGKGILDLERLLRRAVAGALQHAKVGAPRPYGLPVLVGHDPGDLVEMS